jgi:hypothetical protein
MSLIEGLFVCGDKKDWVKAGCGTPTPGLTGGTGNGAEATAPGLYPTLIIYLILKSQLSQISK